MKFHKASIMGFIVGVILIQVQGEEFHDLPKCNLTKKLIGKIASYKSTVDMIIKEVTTGRFKGSTYNFVADFTDKFGNRITGSKNLENAIDYMLDLSKKHNLENVHGENVTVPHWVRGNESATMIKPRYQNLRILGSGLSLPTPPEGIQAEVVVVSSLDELRSIRSKVPGKIVVYNLKFTLYLDDVDEIAANSGAVAVLTRSSSNFSMYTPHILLSGEAKIPQAFITEEDTLMLERHYKRGTPIVIALKMNSTKLPDSISRNTIADIKGRKNPDAMVIVSGHLDSWDVGAGVVDDAGGALLSWNSVVILKALNLRPRRTLRALLFTGEEQGYFGSKAYVEKHRNDKINFAFESDIGTFTPLGLEVLEEDNIDCILTEILKLFKSINATSLRHVERFNTDIDVFHYEGIPTASLYNKNKRYFWYIHSDADRLDAYDPDTLDLCTAFWTGVSYIISDLSVDMPKNRYHPSKQNRIHRPKKNRIHRRKKKRNHRRKNLLRAPTLII